MFPALEERLRARRTHLEPIDLRWGVETVSAEEEEAKELLVLKVCLAEVERSRPFLIGLLGDRYGWVPPEERMQAAAREAGFEQPVAGRSVTDLEIDFGVLSSTEQRRRCRFYFREPLPYAELIATGRMTPETAADYSDGYRSGDEAGSSRLVALKARIRQALPERVQTYHAVWDAGKQAVTGLEAWGVQVLEDLWQELEQETAEWAQAGEATWQAAERFTMEQFIEDRTRDFVGRETILTDLESLALSPSEEGQPWGACVTAAAGAGKSALFAALTRRLQENDDIIILAHAAGIGPASTQVDRLLRRWIEELAGIAGATEPLAEDAKAEEVEQTFQSLLGRVSTPAAGRAAARCAEPVRTHAPCATPHLAAEAVAAQCAADRHRDPRYPKRSTDPTPRHRKQSTAASRCAARRRASPPRSASATAAPCTPRCSNGCSRSNSPIRLPQQAMPCGCSWRWRS